MGTEGGTFRVIAGRYRLEARIGRGGMGVVWRATDQLLGRRVAVKELPQDETLSEADARLQRDRTLREASAVAQLRHPHVIVVHDVVEQDERPYIVMELIDGGSLADRIAAHGPVDAAEAARIGADLLSALRAAHEGGVLHRDIKPANVLVESGTGRVVLTDFGIAQVAGATTLTETGSFVGSPEYTAPERMSGVRTGPEADLWSLGALLCTALSGESPFRRDSLGGILHAVVIDEIRPPAQAAPLLPVVRGLLERDPGRRLDAVEAERMLRAFLDTGRTPPRRAPERSYTPTQRDLPLRRPAVLRDHPLRRSAPERDQPPRPSPAPSRSVRGVRAALAGSRRGALLAALLVAALAGAGVSAALLADRGGDGNGRTGPGSSAPGTPTAGSTSGTPTAGSAPGTPTTGSVPGTPTAGSTPTAALPIAPSGYRVAEDPAGFALAVPEGFGREPQGERVFYVSPGETFRIGVRVVEPEPGGPLGVMRRAAAKGPAVNPGYRDGRVTSTAHRGHPAALWEFTWDGFSAAEGARHTYDLCWEADGRLYDVWVSAPVGKVREAKEHFDVAVDTFTAT
ncbi:serine/threonine-protein kinase [Streptomyces sp. SID13726]|uniref:serine/threonine-protein kinase n=1 Tax=Streptomyces sp. SID13726 TaxID=2706058 RepID=UPI0013B66AF7|nr:serine/threonine-protein kinase [Streptomyces sp. SID13726]NEA99908.1 serine/threonine protein kinase [Streptomyces sp. SID13726]